MEFFKAAFLDRDVDVGFAQRGRRHGRPVAAPPAGCRRVVVSVVRRSMARPHAAMIHQAAGRAPAAIAAPITAMPSAEPTWRLVAATAAATPAWARGRPETAVSVIGALTKPKPRPNSAYVRERSA